ncbi:MAG TPA: hypothetical protein VH593_06125 [Ktedonobacteraceae bacterium]
MKIFTFYMSGKNLKVRQPNGRVTAANPEVLYRSMTLRTLIQGKRGYIELHGSHDQFNVTPGAQKYLLRWAAENSHMIGKDGRLMARNEYLPDRSHPRTHAQRLAKTQAMRTGRTVHVMHAMAGVA